MHTNSRVGFKTTISKVCAMSETFWTTFAYKYAV